MDNKDYTHKRYSSRSYVPARRIRYTKAIEHSHEKENSQANNSDPYAGGIYRATCVIAIAAVLTFGAAVIQAVIFNGQLDAMKHTDYAINDQLKEARIQNETTREQIRANIATDGVASEPFPPNSPTTIGWNINPRWKNTGSTNAVNYRNWFDIVFIEGEKEKVWGAADCPKLTRPGSLVHPNTIPPGGTMVQLAKQLKMPDALRAAKNEGAIFFVGHLEYRDVFKDSPLHHHDWCDLLVPNNVATNQFSFIGFFQETD